MSRTFRRKSAKPTNRAGRSHSIYWYVHKLVDVRNGDSAHNANYCSFPAVKLTGKEYDKAYHMYHGDTRPGFGWADKGSKSSPRMHNKNEVLKWINNPEYEPVLKEFLDYSKYS